MPVKLKLNAGDTVDITAITKTNQGSGSGLDSDLLDGLHASALELIARKGAASGYCDLDASILVPLARIPATLTGKDADTVDSFHGADLEKLANKGAASGYASLNASSLVVQNPASKGLPNGLAELDSGGKVLSSQIPTPETLVEFYEDFLGFSSGSGGNGVNTICNYSWFRFGAFAVQGVGGLCIVDGDGTNQGAVVANVSGGNISKPWGASKNPELRVRWAQLGTVAGTRRIGLGIDILTSDPTDGIYFRHSVTGNIIAVCRASSAETTLDTGVAAADGVYHTGRLVVTGGGTNVEVFIDGISKGNITTNIPTPLLGLTAGSGGTAINTGLNIDYFHMRQNR